MRHLYGLLLITISLHYIKMQVRNENISQIYPFDSHLFSATRNVCKCDEETSCIRKCCGLNYFWREKSCIFNSSVEFIVDTYIGEKRVSKLKSCYLLGKSCSEETSYYRLEPHNFTGDLFYPQYDGKLWLPYVNKHFDVNNYCLDYFEDIGISALVCEDKLVKTERRINTVGMIISLPCLLATFAVNALLTEKNLHTVSLMCYLLSVFGAYLCLVLAEELDIIDDPSCILLGTFCLYFFMSSFLWMNLLAFTIWRKFRRITAKTAGKRKLRRILFYGIYAWGGALVFVIAVIVINNLSPPGEWYAPGLGHGQCWFTPGIPSLLYFYGPMSVITIANVIFFSQTAWRIKKMQTDSVLLRNNGNNKISGKKHYRQRFYLYLKLFLIMGINWIVEIISWAVSWQIEGVPSSVWILTDFCNALLGLFIFFTYVLRKDTWKLLRKRYFTKGIQLQFPRRSHPQITVTTTVTAVSYTKNVTDA